MTNEEFEKKLSEHGWFWSCWEQLWRKDEKTIKTSELNDVVILTENNKSIELTKHDCLMYI